jgi:hypothetical protein
MLIITPDKRTTPLWWLNPWAYALSLHKALHATHQLYLETNEKLDRAEGDLHDAGVKIQELRHRVEVMASHFRKLEDRAKPLFEDKVGGRSIYAPKAKQKPKKRAKR